MALMRPAITKASDAQFIKKFPFWVWWKFDYHNGEKH